MSLTVRPSSWQGGLTFRTVATGSALGDAQTELGNYDKAAEAYQKMVNLRPDLSSYNRAAYFRFLYGDADWQHCQTPLPRWWPDGE